MSNTILIIGLGNPGPEYEKTRHNAGRMALMRWRKKEDLPEFVENKKLFALVSEGKIKSHKVIAALPQTFMNNSGKAVGALAKYYKVKPSQVVILHDDMDIPLGRMKISFAKSAGGHKGVASCLRALKTEEAWRFRIGTGKSSKWRERNLNKLVIAKFSAGEALKLAHTLRDVSEALTLTIAESPEAAMNEYN